MFSGRLNDSGIGAWSASTGEAIRAAGAAGAAYLWEVDAKSIHVHAVQEGTEILVEAGYRFVQQLQMHHVGFQVSHGIAELAKCWLESGEWEVIAAEC